MKKTLHTLLFAPLLYFCSCEKQTNITSNQCPDLIQNVITDDFPMDSYGVNKVEVIEEELHVNVTYGGGCEDHEFKLVMEPFFLEHLQFIIIYNLVMILIMMFVKL